MKNYLLFPLLINLLGSVTSLSIDGNQPTGCDIHNLGNENTESYSTPINFTDAISAMVKIPESWKKFSIGFDSSSNDAIGTLTFTKDSDISLTLKNWDSANTGSKEEVKLLPEDISSKLQPEKWIKISLTRNYGTLKVVIDNAEQVTFDNMDTSLFHYIYGYVSTGHYMDVGFNCLDIIHSSTSVPRQNGENIEETKPGGSGVIIGVILFIIILVAAVVGGVFWYKKKKNDRDANPFDSLLERVTCGRVKTNPLDGCLERVTCGRVKTNPLDGFLERVNCGSVEARDDSEANEEKHQLMGEKSKSSETHQQKAGAKQSHLGLLSDTGRDKVSLTSMEKLFDSSDNGKLAPKTSDSEGIKSEHEVKQTSQNNDDTQLGDEKTISSDMYRGVQAGTLAFTKDINPDTQEETNASDNPVNTASSTPEKDGQEKSDESVSVTSSSASDDMKSENEETDMKQNETSIRGGPSPHDPDKTEALEDDIHVKGDAQMSDKIVSDTILQSTIGNRESENDEMLPDHGVANEDSSKEKDKLGNIDGDVGNENGEKDHDSGVNEQGESESTHKAIVAEVFKVDNSEPETLKENNVPKIDTNETSVEDPLCNNESSCNNIRSDQISMDNEFSNGAPQSKELSNSTIENVELTGDSTGDEITAESASVVEKSPNEISHTDAKQIPNNTDENSPSCVDEVVDKRTTKNEESFSDEEGPTEKLNEGQTTERHENEDNNTKNYMEEIESQIVSAESSSKYEDEKDNAEAKKSQKPCIASTEKQQDEGKIKQGTGQDPTTETKTKDECGTSDGQHAVTEEIITQERINKCGESDTSQPDRLRTFEETNKDVLKKNIDTGNS